MRPLTGPMDSRSNPEDAPPLSFRFKLNMEVDDSDKLARGTGWQKFLAGAASYLNQDAHDQGDCYDISATREAITFLYEATTTGQVRRLYRGTRTKLAFLIEGSGEWVTIARGFGGGGTGIGVRWRCGQAVNTLIFTNGVDKPQSHTIGTAPAICGDNSVSEVPDLNTLKISRAGVVGSFSGCVFLGDVTEDGVRYPSRLRWSGANAPLTWVPGASTAAGFQDFPYTETILAVIPLGGNVIVLTDQGIYRGFVNANTFQFTPVYQEPKNRDKCLVYPDTLVSDGRSLWYAGRDGFYRWDLYMNEPERPEWLWRSSNLVFDNLDTSCCTGPVGEYWPAKKSILWSWPKAGDGCINYRTIRCNLRVNTADIIDHGFTAFVNYRSYTRQTLLEWLAEFCTTDLTDLCAAISGKRIIEFCKDCNAQQLFVGVSSQDWCLKQLGTSYARDVCTNAATGEGSVGQTGQYDPFTGEYEEVGYFSVVRAMFPLGNLDRDKQINDFLLEPKVTFQLGDANYWRLRVGNSYQARDANPEDNVLAFAYLTDDLAPEYVSEFATDGGYCQVQWIRQRDREVRCIDAYTISEMIAQGIRGNEGETWVLFQSGRFAYYELSVISKNEAQQVVPPLGAIFTVSRLTVAAKVCNV